MQCLRAWAGYQTYMDVLGGGADQLEEKCASSMRTAAGATCLAARGGDVGYTGQNAILGVTADDKVAVTHIKTALSGRSSSHVVPRVARRHRSRTHRRRGGSCERMIRCTVDSALRFTSLVGAEFAHFLSTTVRGGTSIFIPSIPSIPVASIPIRMFDVVCLERTLYIGELLRWS